ncbi:ADAMTS-like protein 5 isoform X5 [Rattus norvegicus]|uniref:ADAMTS-like protein 5 isoform X5 n=1 Tax=Rattus norvegicus TaxID=10116 RepID=UPI0019170244|nr:ADAMTS-like protein 5 isoform X5 [Rattus norvegicus]
MRAPLACALSDPSLGAPGRPGWEGSTKFAVPHFGAPPLPPVPGATQGSLDALPWALSNWVSETHGPSSASFHCTDEEPEAWKNGMVGSWPPRKRTHDWFQAPMPCCEQLELSLAQRESVHLASCRAALRAQTRGPREVWLPSKTTQSARAEMAVHSDSADHCLLGTQCSLRPRLFPPLLFLLWILLSCDLRGAAQGPGEWTLWGSWSRCSSSCGRGVSVRRRHCVRLPEEELCWGDSHEYRVCQLPFYPSTFMLTQDCPPGAIPFRDLQCSLYNGHPVLGTQKTYQWVPFHGAPNLCDLNCLAEGHAFYHSFGRVLDGTPCTPGTQGLCVAGRCLSAGCDGLLGSGTLEDRCGLCGGANDSCLFVQRVFRDAGAFAGYWNVTLIPEGARHIRVTQRSHNHLALVTRDGHYVLNGDGVLSLPGTYEAAGTRVVYTRSAGPEETLQATGPTSQELLLQVLLREPNPGVHFEFWLPRERYGSFQAQVHALGWPLRQPQPREVEPQPAETTVVPEAIPARVASLAPDPCGPCPDSRGRAHRLLHYCGSDFVFQARVLGRHRLAQETRYEVRVLLIYKNRSPLRSREYVWAPGHCPCPPLAPHREYLLATRRHVSPDGTQDRLLLPQAGYARLWSPAEDSRVRLAARRCPV